MVKKTTKRKKGGKKTETERRRGRPHATGGHTVFGAFLKNNEILHEEAAKDLEITRVYVSSLARGLKYPSAELMWAIEQWTDGSVTMQSWFQEA